MHSHQWALMRFELVDGHPYVAQTCIECGFLRRYRAWERSWDPAATTLPGRLVNGLCAGTPEALRPCPVSPGAGILRISTGRSPNPVSRPEVASVTETRAAIPAPRPGTIDAGVTQA